MLSIVSMGQQDLCKWTNYLRKVTYLPLNNKTNIYTLPPDCYRINRIELFDYILPLYTRDDIDNLRTISTDYVAFKSNLDINKLEIYPTPEDITEPIKWVQGDVTGTIYIQDVYGVVTAATGADYIIIGENYGEVTDVERCCTEEDTPSTKFGEVFDTSDMKPSFDTGSNLGVVVDVTQSSGSVYGFITSVRPNHIVSNKFGLIADAAIYDNSLKVYYTAIPAKLKYLEENLVVPELWEDLLVRYVVGTALQDDNDANNIQRGETELQKYQQQLSKLRTESAKDFSGGAKKKLVINYRRI